MTHDEIIAHCHAAAEGAIMGVSAVSEAYAAKSDYEHMTQVKGAEHIVDALSRYLEFSDPPDADVLLGVVGEALQVPIDYVTDIPTHVYFEVFAGLYKYLTGIAPSGSRFKSAEGPTPDRKILRKHRKITEKPKKGFRKYGED